MSADLALGTIAELSDLLSARKISSVELVTACLERIDSYDRYVNAFITLVGESALAQARQADKEIASGNYRGPMHGVPFAVKDIINTKGIRTTAHSKILQGNVPETNATAVDKLLSAGAILIGKVATHEFAHGAPAFDLPWPPARNPWNPAYVTGGSSSGSAASVAAGFVPAAIGSDTGGSVRSPSALCGITGLKPTYGLVSRAGILPNSYTMDNCGPLAWNTEDCAILLDILAGYDPRDPASARHQSTGSYRKGLNEDIKGLRIGVLRHFWEEDTRCDPAAVSAVEEAMKVLTKLGAQVSSARMRAIQQYYDTKIIIAESEMLSVHLADFRKRASDYGRSFRNRVLAAMFLSSVDYVEAQRERRVLVDEMSALYEQFDVLIAIGPAPAFRLDKPHDDITFWKGPSVTTPFNVTAGPTMSQCIGFSKDGLPLSMQVVSRPFNEHGVFRVAYAYEKATHWRNQRPQLRDAGPIAIPPHAPVSPSEEELRLAQATCDRLGIALKQSEMEELAILSPYVHAMASRVRRDRSRFEEPANVFAQLQP